MTESSEVTPTRPTALHTFAFEAMEEADIPYCVLHSHDFVPRVIPSKDVVCLVPKKYINTQVPRALAARGLVIVQDIHRAGGSHAHQFVLTEDLGNAGALLRLDLITDYGPSGQILYAADDLLKSRQRREGFWALSPDLQFICYLVKKVIKGDLDGLRERRLSAFYNHDPDGCRRELERCWGGSSARSLTNAAESGDWSRIRARRRSLRWELWLRSTLREPLGMLFQCLREAKRSFTRCVHPTGLHVAIVGPDGVGKSSVIQEVTAALKPAFWRIHTSHFPLRLSEREGENPSHGTHRLPPWPLPLSVLKIMFLLTVVTVHHLLWIYQRLIRTTLVVFDRDLVDLLVDPKRFRYGGPGWLAKTICRLAPKAELVILLDAPAETIQARKSEVPLDETARRVCSYRELVGKMPYGVAIDVSRPLEAVVSDVKRAVLEHLAARTAKRLSLEDRQ